jgi:hypothetical protein
MRKMRKILIGILLGLSLGISFSLFAWVNPSQNPPSGGGVLQTSNTGLTINTSTYFISGNVGIGTTAPGAKLDVVGDLKAGDSKVRIYNDSGYGAVSEVSGYLRIRNTNLEIWDGKYIDVRRTIANGGGRNIYLNGEGDSYLNALTGNVGIGTTNPQRLLQVGSIDGIVQVGNVFSALISGDDGGHALFGTNIYIDSNGVLRTAGTHTSNYGYAGIHASWGNLNFYAATGNTTADAAITPTSRLFIRGSDGNVGIGTTAPVLNLEVSGNSATWVVAGVRNLSSGSNSWSEFRLGNDTASNKLVMFCNSSTRTADGGAGNCTIRTDTGLLHLSAGGGQKVTINTAGNVGIGTTNPGYKLTVNGSVYATDFRICIEYYSRGGVGSWEGPFYANFGQWATFEGSDLTGVKFRLYSCP